MILANELCDKFKEPLKDAWGYIFGKSGQLWTKAQQDAATRPQTVSYGRQWIGHRVADCSGLFVWAIKQFGESIYHGSNTIWSDYCSKQGKLNKGQRCDGIALKPGTAVFLLNDTGRHHIGLYIGDDTVIEAKGTKWGVVTSHADHWDEWGELKQVDYSMYPDEVIPMTKPTLRKGDRGDEVRQLQTMLDRCGYVIDIDGAYGARTEAAVKGFQRGAGLTVDGICGPKTWAALEEALNGVEADDPDEDDDDFPGKIVVDRETLQAWRDSMSEIIDELDRLLV